MTYISREQSNSFAENESRPTRTLILQASSILCDLYIREFFNSIPTMHFRIRISRNSCPNFICYCWQRYDWEFQNNALWDALQHAIKGMFMSIPQCIILEFPDSTQSMIAYEDFDYVFLEIPVKTYIVRMLLTWAIPT